MRVLRFPAAGLLIATRLAAAQTQYYNLDAGRPGRIEDAEATALYALDIDPASLQFERVAGGFTRIRAEPRLAYGVLPFTEVELRFPLVGVVPPHRTGSRATLGLGGVGVGFTHAFNVETSGVPALAVSGEWLAPAGSLAGPQGAYSVKLMATKTASIGRWHVNAGVGTYSIRLPARALVDSSCSSLVTVTFAGTPCSTSPPIVIDAPCSVSHAGGDAPSRFCMGSAFPDTAAAPIRTSLAGRHWIGGIGYDRAFGLRSTLLTADVFAEKFVGLYSKADVTAEAGIRHQVGPIMAIDAGAAWHFAGTLRSIAVTAGASYEFPARGLFRWL